MEVNLNWVIWITVSPTGSYWLINDRSSPLSITVYRPCHKTSTWDHKVPLSCNGEKGPSSLILKTEKWPILQVILAYHSRLYSPSFKLTLMYDCNMFFFSPIFVTLMHTYSSTLVRALLLSCQSLLKWAITKTNNYIK